MRSVIRMAVIQATGLDESAVVSGDADSIRARPFVNLQWAESTPGVGPVDRRALVVWFHDLPGDYTTIDRMVKQVRAALDVLAPERTETGWLTGVTWVTDSGDLTNDDRGTIVRTSTYTIVGT